MVRYHPSNQTLSVDVVIAELVWQVTGKLLT